MREMSKKVCLLGAFAAGKTSLIRRFVHNRFDDKYISTIGVKVSRKTVSIAHDDKEITKLNMMLWDLDGRSEFDQIRASYLRGTAGAAIVCDLTRTSTLDAIHHHVAGLQQIAPGCQIVLAANKSDLVNEHQVTEVQIQRLAQTYGAPYYITSAKSGDEVDEMFRRLGSLLLK